MMGCEPSGQDDIFSYDVALERRVRTDHPLRRIKRAADFSFIYEEVKDTYGTRGNVSVPPAVILKLMLLLIMYNVRPEREFMETLPERLDWLWLPGYNLDTAIHGHSVLPKTRRRLGEEAFRTFFEGIVIQCVEKGLIDGTKIFMDASFIDPGASIVHQGGRSKLRYKTRRAVDAKSEVVTALHVTPGAVNEAHCMTTLVDIHASNTGTEPETVVADSKHGTMENLLVCRDRQIKAHMPALRTRIKDTGSREGIYPDDRFIYDKETGTLTCPAGQKLVRRTFHQQRNTVEHAAPKKVCRTCRLKDECTRNKTGGRSAQRHARKEELDEMPGNTQSPSAKRDIKARQHLMERSFARSVRYSLDRARRRGLWRVAIKEYLACTPQNIMTLIGSTGKRLTGAVGLRDLKEGSVIIPRMMEGRTLFPVYAVGKIMPPMPVL